MAGKSVQERNKILRERATERERKRKDNAERGRALSFAEEEKLKREARFQHRGHRETEGTEKTGSFENSSQPWRERAVKKDGQKDCNGKNETGLAAELAIRPAESNGGYGI
jgi:hypothetical protein